MTYAVFLYHSNAHEIYEQKWIDTCLESIRDQTFQKFNVVECDYGGSSTKLYPGSQFYNVRLPTFADAVNLLMDYASDQDYDGAFNVHLDDHYSPDRFELQVAAMEKGFDLVSSNFCYSYGNRTEPSSSFHASDIKQELKNGVNVLCNPVVAYSKHWLDAAVRYDPEQIPYEDMHCWLANMDMRMTVLPDCLCTKRFHPAEASNSSNR